jgi:esterase/lipase
MRQNLEGVRVPVLLVQSHMDPAVSQEKSEHLLNALKSMDKELFWLDDAGHSIVQDAQCCGTAFEKIAAFLHRTAPLS